MKRCTPLRVRRDATRRAVPLPARSRNIRCRARTGFFARQNTAACLKEGEPSEPLVIHVGLESAKRIRECASRSLTFVRPLARGSIRLGKRVGDPVAVAAFTLRSPPTPTPVQNRAVHRLKSMSLDRRQTPPARSMHSRIARRTSVWPSVELVTRQRSLHPASANAVPDQPRRTPVLCYHSRITNVFR